MRKISAALFGLFLWLACAAPVPAEVVGTPNQIACNSTKVFTGTGAAASTIVGVAGRVTFICGWTITNTAATGSFQITFGTGANCGTGTVTVTPVMSITSTAPSTDHIEFAGLSAATGADVCMNATLTTVTGILWFGQY